jgi:hypothetical protein
MFFILLLWKMEQELMLVLCVYHWCSQGKHDASLSSSKCIV